LRKEIRLPLSVEQGIARFCQRLSETSRIFMDSVYLALRVFLNLSINFSATAQSGVWPHLFCESINSSATAQNLSAMEFGHIFVRRANPSGHCSEAPGLPWS